MEWIPYNHLRNIQHLTNGGFSTIYEAIWLVGGIEKWDSENRQWRRYSFTLGENDYENAKKEDIKSPLNENEKTGRHIVLKSLNDSSNIKDFLNEVNNNIQ